MGEVTWDEIRRACESVGWVERDYVREKRWRGFQCPKDRQVRLLWGEEVGYCASANDALALLEATGCPYTIDRHLRPEPSWIVHIEHPGMGHGTMSGDSLFEAGIRAVVALAESRAELGHV
jgi:hypothetical protein